MNNRLRPLVPLGIPLGVAASLSMLVTPGRSLAQSLPAATPSCGVAGASLGLLGMPHLFCQRQEVTADVLVFRNTSPPSGAIKPTVIALQPGRGQYLGISFFESRLDSAGDQWRSAGWTAITSSSLQLGDSLNQYSVSFDAEGNIDGPSAGGFFTTSTLALLLGNSLQRDVTMTGTINPDGSIGPVGGIPVKVQAAHEQGKRRVVIPAGQMTPELQTLETELGIDVQEAADIGEAYAALTGRSLPTPQGYADVPPEMAAAGAATLQPLVADLHQRYQTEAEALKTTAIPEELKGIQREARERFSQSRQALSRGELAQAYATGRDATTRIRLLQNLLQTQASLAEFRDQPWDISVLTQTWEPVTAEAEALLKDLEAIEVTTANEAISISRAFGHLILALGLKNLALEEIDALKTAGAAADPESEAYRRALFYLAIAPTLGADQVQTAQETLSLKALGRGQRLDEREVAGFTNTLNTAAVAGIKAFESLTIQPLAASRAEAFEVVAAEFKAKDTSYFMALAALGSMDELIESLEDQDNAVYARLGASQAAYLIASTLISKYYSLKASYDPNLEALGIRLPVEFENQRGLINMLDLAERNARSTIAMAEGAGNDLTQQILMYEQAKFLREGTPADKIDALQLFWNTSLESRLMTIFAGDFQLNRQSWPRWGWPLLGVGVASVALIGWRYRHRVMATLKRT